ELREAVQQHDQRPVAGLDVVQRDVADVGVAVPKLDPVVRRCDGERLDGCCGVHGDLLSGSVFLVMDAGCRRPRSVASVGIPGAYAGAVVRKPGPWAGTRPPACRPGILAGATGDAECQPRSRQPTENGVPMTTQLTTSMNPQFRTIDGLHIRYAGGGSQESTVLLTSPWPESIHAFTSIWATLSEHARLFAVDLPGF